MQHAYLKHILAIYKHIKAAILGVGEEQGAKARGRERQNERGREGKRRGERQGEEGVREGKRRGESQFRTTLVTVEVGSRGFLHKRILINFYTLVKAPHKDKLTLEKEMTHRAILGSFRIWCRRN